MTQTQSLRIPVRCNPEDLDERVRAAVERATDERAITDDEASMVSGGSLPVLSKIVIGLILDFTKGSPI